MFTKILKSFILGLGIAALPVITAFAASPDKAAAFPFEIEFDVEECGRICYAGHPGGTVQYRDGIAVTPDSTFRIRALGEGPAQFGVEDLSVTISVIYENDSHSGSFRETVKQYDGGDLNYEDDFRILSDNTAANLEERNKLFSDSLTGLEMTLVSKTRDARKKTVYLYVCSDDDYLGYLENMPEAEQSETPADPYEDEEG